MSLLSKFASIFGSSQTTQASSTPINQQLQEVLAQILKPSSKFNLKQKSEVLAQFLLDKEEHADLLFAFLQTTSQDLNPYSVVQLLAVIHQQFQYNELIQDIALKLRETKMPWVQLEKQEWPIMITEPDQPRKAPSQVILTEIEDQGKPAAIYAQLCYVYLQRLAANIDLYRAVARYMYPYATEKEQLEPKLMFLWHYKIQNLINSALVLLQYDATLVEIQQALYSDVWKFQKFICSEIGKIIDQYATLPNSDTLSLYEIFTESSRHYEILLLFYNHTSSTTQPPPQCQINNTLLQEFYAFVSKLKVLNQFTFKKSLKVPNKQNPCMGVPTRNPKVSEYLNQAMHIRATSGQFLTDDSEEDEKDQVNELDVDDQQKQKKVKKLHLRGQSTFQND